MTDPTLAESIFLAALEKSDLAARTAYLDEACKGDSDLRRRVERLLEAQAQVGGFLEQPIAGNLADLPSAHRTSSDGDGHVRPALDETQADDSGRAKADEQLGFLAPSGKPGSLGRLDHYEILEVVGKGGFGVVFKAFDEKLHRVVAIKTLSPELAANGTARQRFIREARTAAAVTHEHVVTIHAVVEEHRPPYLVMQMIDGVTLQQKLDKSGTLSLREILRIGMQMAEGLAAAHKQGLVHRDIKPANILLENGIERVKITDFGLARAVDDASVTQSGVVAGTPMYMSPEQAEGLQIEHRSDLFSLGTVLYAMCTGHPPFRASSTMAVLKRVTDASPRPIREINSDIPDWLCDIIGKLHAKKPEERFQTAKEVAELLGQRLADVQAGREIVAARHSEERDAGRAVIASPIAPTATRRGKHAALVVTSIIGLLLLIGGYIAGPFAYRYVTGRSTVELTGTLDFYLQKVMLEQDGQVVAELSWSSPQAVVGPGRYEVRIVCVEGYEATKLNVDMTSISLYQGAFQRLLGQMGSIEVARGDHVAISVAVEKKAISPPATQPGWVQLFNGENLAGWKSHPDQKNQWSVVNSELVSSGTPGYLFTDRGDLRNFHLRAEVLISAQDQVGVFFRTPFDLQPRGKPRTQRHDADYFWEGGGTMIWRTAESVEIGSGPGKWQMFEIRFVDNRLEISVDGRNRFTSFHDKATSRPGHLALQATKNVRFKKIEIQPLSSAPPDGWVQLFNGKDLTGWKSTLPAAHEVKDGSIIVKGRAFLFTDKEFKDFWLRADVRYQTNANGHLRFPSGVAGIGVAAVIGNDAKQKTGSLRIADQRAEGKLHDAMPDPKTEVNSWFTLELLVRDGHATVKVNGTTTAQATVDALAKRGAIGLGSNQPGTIIEFRKVEIKQLPPPNAAPFVILAKDQRAESRHATLADAVKAAQSGDTIEIRGDGPFETEPIAIGKKALTLRAGAGVRPHLKHQPTDPASRQSLLRTEGALVLEGLTLERGANPGGKTMFQGTSIVSVHGGRAHFANCRFVGHNVHFGVGLADVTEGIVTNCEILGNSGSHCSCGVIPVVSSHVLLENNVMAGYWIGPSFVVGQKEFVTFDDIALSLRHNTIRAAGVALGVHTNALSNSPRLADPKATRMRFEAAGNIFSGQTELVFGILDKSPPLENAPPLLLKMAAFKDDDNLYHLSLNTLLSVTRAGEPAHDSLGNLQAWHKFWGVAKSRSWEGVPAFVGGDVLAKTLTDPASVSPADFRLTNTSAGKGAGPGGRDVGADVDLVGPGAAFEKWKKTTEYQEWRKQTDEMMTIAPSKVSISSSKINLVESRGSATVG